MRNQVEICKTLLEMRNLKLSKNLSKDVAAHLVHPIFSTIMKMSHCQRKLLFRKTFNVRKTLVGFLK